MKTIVLLLTIGTSLAVPVENQEEWERVKKSAWYSSSVPSGSTAPVGLYEAASAPHPRYLEIEQKVNHKRSYYNPAAPIPAPHIAPHPTPSYSGSVPVASGSSYSGLVPAAHALAELAVPPAVGLFRNARVGGCNVPLLLSCSPNVVTGHLAASHGYSAPAYRDNGDFMREAGWVKHTRAANHHKISEDYPDPQKGSHHTISKDYPEPNLTRIVKPPSEPYENVEATNAVKQ